MYTYCLPISISIIVWTRLSAQTKKAVYSIYMCKYIRMEMYEWVIFNVFRELIIATDFKKQAKYTLSYLK